MLLRPDAWVTRVMKFCLGWAASFYKMELHAVDVLSNHYHLVITDRFQNLPQFMGWVNKISSLFIAEGRNRVGEATWDASEKYTAVMLTTEQAVWKELSYVTINAVRHGLVRTHTEWGGFVTRPKDIYKPIATTHPGRFVLKKMAKPIIITKPPILAHLGDRKYVNEYTRLIKEQEAAVRRALPKDKRGRPKVVGMKQVMHRSPMYKAKTKEERYCYRPVFAAVTKEGIKKAKEKFRKFYLAYRIALDEWRDGEREVVFPYGTYKMRVLHRANCATGH